MYTTSIIPCAYMYILIFIMNLSLSTHLLQFCARRKGVTHRTKFILSRAFHMHAQLKTGFQLIFLRM